MYKTVLAIAMVAIIALLSLPLFAWNEGGGEQDEATKTLMRFKEKSAEEL